MQNYMLDNIYNQTSCYFLHRDSHNLKLTEVQFIPIISQETNQGLFERDSSDNSLAFTEDILNESTEQIHLYSNSSSTENNSSIHLSITTSNEVSTHHCICDECSNGTSTSLDTVFEHDGYESNFMEKNPAQNLNGSKRTYSEALNNNGGDRTSDCKVPFKKPRISLSPSIIKSETCLLKAKKIPRTISLSPFFKFSDDIQSYIIISNTQSKASNQNKPKCLNSIEYSKEFDTNFHVQMSSVDILNCLKYLKENVTFQRLFSYEHMNKFDPNEVKNENDSLIPFLNFSVNLLFEKVLWNAFKYKENSPYLNFNIPCEFNETTVSKYGNHYFTYPAIMQSCVNQEKPICFSKLNDYANMSLQIKKCSCRDDRSSCYCTLPKVEISDHCKKCSCSKDKRTCICTKLVETQFRKESSLQKLKKISNLEQNSNYVYNQPESKEIQEIFIQNKPIPTQETQIQPLTNDNSLKILAARCDCKKNNSEIKTLYEDSVFSKICNPLKFKTHKIRCRREWSISNQNSSYNQMHESRITEILSDNLEKYSKPICNRKPANKLSTDFNIEIQDYERYQRKQINSPNSSQREKNLYTCQYDKDKIDNTMDVCPGDQSNKTKEMKKNEPCNSSTCLLKILRKNRNAGLPKLEKTNCMSENHDDNKRNPKLMNDSDDRTSNKCFQNYVTHSSEPEENVTFIYENQKLKHSLNLCKISQGNQKEKNNPCTCGQNKIHQPLLNKDESNISKINQGDQKAKINPCTCGQNKMHHPLLNTDESNISVTPSDIQKIIDALQDTKNNILGINKTCPRNSKIKCFKNKNGIICQYQLTRDSTVEDSTRKINTIEIRVTYPKRKCPKREPPTNDSFTSTEGEVSCVSRKKRKCKHSACPKSVEADPPKCGLFIPAGATDEVEYLYKRNLETFVSPSDKILSNLRENKLCKGCCQAIIEKEKQNADLNVECSPEQILDVVEYPPKLDINLNDKNDVQCIFKKSCFDEKPSEEGFKVDSCYEKDCQESLFQMDSPTKCTKQKLLDQLIPNSEILYEFLAENVPLNHNCKNNPTTKCYNLNSKSFIHQELVSSSFKMDLLDHHSLAHAIDAFLYSKDI